MSQDDPGPAGKTKANWAEEIYVGLRPTPGSTLSSRPVTQIFQWTSSAIGSNRHIPDLQISRQPTFRPLDLQPYRWRVRDNVLAAGTWSCKVHHGALSREKSPAIQMRTPSGTVKNEITNAGVAIPISQLRLNPKTKQPKAGPPEPPRLQPGISVERAAKTPKTAGKIPPMISPTLVVVRKIFSPNECVRGQIVGNYSPLDYAVDRPVTPRYGYRLCFRPVVQFGKMTDLDDAGCAGSR